MREKRVREGARRRRRRSGRMVRGSKHAIYSVRSRVRTFRNGGVRRRRRHREYRALRYRVVYVGAIAVLLRFVVMRLNRNEWEEPKESSLEGATRGERVREGSFYGRRTGGLVARTQASGISMFGGTGEGVGVGVGAVILGVSSEERWAERRERHRHREEMERRTELGQYRYTEGRKQIGRAGRVRRVARMGAVVLTREDYNVEKSKSQRVSTQLSRSFSAGNKE